MGLIASRELARVFESKRQEPKDRLSALLDETAEQREAHGGEVQRSSPAVEHVNGRFLGFLFRVRVVEHHPSLAIEMPVGDSTVRTWRDEETTQINGRNGKTNRTIGITKSPRLQRDSTTHESWVFYPDKLVVHSLDGTAATYKPWDQAYDAEAKKALDIAEQLRLVAEIEPFINGMMTTEADRLGYESVAEFEARDPEAAIRVRQEAEAYIAKSPYFEHTRPHEAEEV